MFAIESANIVGYTTKEAPKGKFIIMGAQFEAVKGGTKINDLIGGIQGAAWDENGAFVKTAPQLQLVNSKGGYDIFYFLEDGWDDVNECDAKGWCDSDGVITDVEVTPGVALWYKSIESGTIPTVSGAVAQEDSSAIDCPANFALRANVYPLSIGVNSNSMTVTGTNGAAWDEEGAFVKTAPQIQLVNAKGGYDIFYFLEDGWDDVNECDAKGWCDSDGVITDAIIPAAQGFWTKGVTGKFTLNFTK